MAFQALSTIVEHDRAGGCAMLSRWGKGFLIAFSIAVFASRASAADDCQLKKLASVPLLDPKNSAAIIPVSVNGKILRFSVDPSISATSMRADIATSLGLSMGQTARGQFNYSARGKQLNVWTYVSNLTIGDENLGAGPVSIRSLPSAVDGTVGSDILRKYDVDYDFAARKLTLFSSEHCRGAPLSVLGEHATFVPFRLDYGNRVTVPILLDGKEIQAVVSTGIPTSLISATLADELFDLDESTPGTVPDPYPSSKEYVPYCYPFKRLTLGELALDRPFICVDNDRGERQYLADHDTRPLAVIRFHLGMDFLARAHVYVAYNEEKLYFVQNDGNAIASH
jgi:hypothetical protein